MLHCILKKKHHRKSVLKRKSILFQERMISLSLAGRFRAFCSSQTLYQPMKQTSWSDEVTDPCPSWYRLSCPESNKLLRMRTLKLSLVPANVLPNITLTSTSDLDNKEASSLFSLSLQRSILGCIGWHGCSLGNNVCSFIAYYKAAGGSQILSPINRLADSL